MSYDIYLRAATCAACGKRGNEPECPEPTYNLTPIFDLALADEPMPNPDVTEFAHVVLGKPVDRPRGLRLLTGKTGQESLPCIARALDRMLDGRMRPEFLKLEPPNKWGNLDDAIDVMKQLKVAAESYPQNVWEIR